MRENKRLQCEGFSSKLKHDFKIPNGYNDENLVSNLVFKFHNDPTVNESEIIIFLRQVRCAAGKERVLREEKRKTKMRRRGGT